QALAGRFCAMLLADLGADVIKIEPPQGDMSRPLGPPPPDREGCDYGGYFASINRNKRSVVLDIKTAAGRDAIFALVKTADAIVENSKAGVMDRPGIGDIYPGTLLALGVVAAIHAARATGKGQFIDVAMYDAVLAMCEAVVYTYSRGGVIRGPQGNGNPVLCPFDIFRTRDGAIAIAAPNENQWAPLCEAMGRRDLISDERCRSNPRRVANAEFVRGVVSSWTATHTKREVLSAISGKVPAGPVNTAKDIFEDPHPRIRNMLVDVVQPGNNPALTIAGCPIKFTDTPSGIYARAPRLGEHTDEVLVEAGISRQSKEK